MVGVDRVRGGCLVIDLCGALGLYWALGGAGFPFGTENDPEAAAESILGSAQSDTAAPVIAGLGLVGAVVTLAMARGRGSRGPRILRAALVVFAWSVAVALLLVIPDLRVLGSPCCWRDCSPSPVPEQRWRSG